MVEPLSIAASVVGLVSAGGKLTAALVSLISNVQNAESLALVALQEISETTTLLSHLQTYALGETQANPERSSLILLDQVITTLTGCVTTYSGLQALLDELKAGDKMSMFDKLKWARNQSKVSTFIQRLQNHKSSLSVMLSILHCISLKEAQEATVQLYKLTEQALHSNQDLAARMNHFERSDSVHLNTVSPPPPVLHDTTKLSAIEEYNETLVYDTWTSPTQHAFEKDLQ
ncbi:hypothetical protein K505DRAFT_295575, partial [Melanomma pulvis-pyrius CBS 109.77]